MGCGASIESDKDRLINAVRNGRVFDFEEFIQRHLKSPEGNDELIAWFPTEQIAEIFQTRFSENSKVKVVIRDHIARQFSGVDDKHYGWVKVRDLKDIDAFESIAQVLKLPKKSGYMLRRMWMISEMMTIITEAWDIKISDEEIPRYAKTLGVTCEIIALVRRDYCCISVPGLANLTSSTTM